MSRARRDVRIRDSFVASFCYWGADDEGATRVVAAVGRGARAGDARRW